MATTLTNLEDDIRQLVDDVNEVLVGDTALHRMINQSGIAWHNMVVQALPSLFETTDTVTPDSTTNSELPTDHYKTLGVRYNDSDGTTRPLKRIQYHERWRYDDGNTTDEAVAYYTTGTALYILPAAVTGSQTYTHDYIPAWTVLSSGGDTVMGLADSKHNMIDGWVQWIVYDVAMKLLKKQELPVNEVLAMKRDIEAIINAAMQDREAAHPERIINTTSIRPWYDYDPDFWRNRT